MRTVYRKQTVLGAFEMVQFPEEMYGYSLKILKEYLENNLEKRGATFKFTLPAITYSE